MKCRLIGMDFDGTLLTDDKKVTEETYKYLEKARKKGIIIVGITARPLGGVHDIINKDAFDYLILNNGAYIYDVKNKVGSYKDKLDRNLAEQITKYAEEYAEQIDYCSGTTYYIYKGTPAQGLFFIKGITSIDEIEEEIARMNIFLTENVKAESLLEELIKKYPEVNPFMMQDSGSTKKWIVINPNNLNKKVTLEDLGKKLNIPLEEMTFFGDGLNDLEVIEAVGNGVAMGNALKEVKNNARDITLSNNEDGIAHYIKTKILRK